MDDTVRTSPLHDQLVHLNPVWGERNGMPVPLRLGRSLDTLSIALTDFSALHRFGLKGPGAAAWLQSQEIAVLPGINQWVRLPGGSAVCRLGGSEFFVEDDWSGDIALRLSRTLRPGTPGVYPVLRQDAALVLGGRRVNELLVQVCGFNFKSLAGGGSTVVITFMAGVSVTVIADARWQLPAYRIWCDGTYGCFLWETLLGIARELGGDALGIEEMFPESSVDVASTSHTGA